MRAGKSRDGLVGLFSKLKSVEIKVITEIVCNTKLFSFFQLLKVNSRES